MEMPIGEGHVGTRACLGGFNCQVSGAVQFPEMLLFPAAVLVSAAVCA